MDDDGHLRHRAENTLEIRNALTVRSLTVTSTTQRSSAGHAPVATPTRVRHKVLGMCMLLASITYLDRVAISVTAADMRRDLGLSVVQMSWVFSAFVLSYGLFEIPTGWWGDRVGARRILTRIVTWWSAFTVLTGAAFSYSQLLVTRFLFGAGEAGAWPNVAIVFSRWIPQRERGTAQGLFFMGAHAAAGLTPILVATLSLYFHWRVLFVMFGAIGFVWSLAWYRWYRDMPREHASVSPEERDYIEAGTLGSTKHDFSHTPWKRLLANRSIVFMCLMYFTQVYGFYLFITWMPTYFRESRGFETVALGLIAGLPMTLSAVADLVGGVSTDRMVRRFGTRTGRTVVGFVSLASAGIFMISGTFIANPYLAAVLLAIGAACSNLLLAAAWNTAVDVGGIHSGVVGATMNTAGQVAGFLSPLVTGYIVQYYSNWDAPLYITGVLYLLGALCWFGIEQKPAALD
jgi:ACS family glucarate transporter-like MFS transporter